MYSYNQIINTTSSNINWFVQFGGLGVEQHFFAIALVYRLVEIENYNVVDELGKRIVYNLYAVHSVVNEFWKEILKRAVFLIYQV
jgi:hypothetical protein